MITSKYSGTKQMRYVIYHDYHFFRRVQVAYEESHVQDHQVSERPEQAGGRQRHREGVQRLVRPD